MPRPSRSELLTQLETALRQISAQSVLISDLVAIRVGVNSTDLECLDLLYLSGPTTAGKLASHIGLTTGAMTAALDRLERAGFVRRHRDRADRRRVLVEAMPRAVRSIAPFYQPLAAAMGTLHETLSDRQLAAAVNYISRALAIGADHVSWLQTQPAIGRHRRTSRAHAGYAHKE